MKEESGLTITSIIIYIIALLVVIGVIATLTSYFYKNINIGDESQLTNEQFTKLNGYFTEEINQNDVRVVEAGSNTENNVNYITFSNKQTYTFSSLNKAIYVNEIKICENIDECTFEFIEEENRDRITIHFKSGNFERTITYVTKS